MIRRTVVLFLLAAMLLVGAGCAAPELKPRGNVTVTLDADKTKTLVTAKVADLLMLELPPVELPGYAWMVFLHDGRYLKQKTAITSPATPEGRPTVSFLAVRVTSKTTVRFLLVKQDSAKENTPINGHDVVFTIQ